MRSLTKTVLAFVAVLPAAAAAAQTQYIASGQHSFIQDLDSNDGIDLRDALPGTWSASFEIDPGSLSFLSNVQNQGGSWTQYTGIVLNSLVLQTNIGELVMTSTDVPGILSLWDRQSFGDGQRQVFLDFNVNGASVRWDIVANANHSLFDTIFNAGTPGPNSFNELPTFDGVPSGMLSNTGITIDDAVLGSPHLLPGRGRYFGDTHNLALVPSPAGLALIALGGVATARRRRR